MKSIKVKGYILVPNETTAEQVFYGIDDLADRQHYRSFVKVGRWQKHCWDKYDTENEGQAIRLRVWLGKIGICYRETNGQFTISVNDLLVKKVWTEFESFNLKRSEKPNDEQKD